MPNLSVLQPTNNSAVTPKQPFPVAGLVTDLGMPEPRAIDSVTVRVDNGAPIWAALTSVPHQKLTTVRFSASVQLEGGEGPHTVTVTATNDLGISATKSVIVLVAAASCVYPQSHQTRRTIMDELRAVAANKRLCSSFYLDTRESHSRSFPFEEHDHHQGLARTHQLSDGSIFFFLSHSETDSGDKGNLMQFRYSGPTDGEHVLTTRPLTVAPLVELLETEEQHPCDMVFLPDVNNADAGYLFLAEQNTHNLSIYHWSTWGPFVFKGSIPQETPPGGPNHVFLDRVEDRYFLGVANVDEKNVGFAKLYAANASELFGKCVPGGMNVSAFQPTSPQSIFDFPVSHDAQQVHLIRDASGKWFLLAFRSVPNDKEEAKDFVDVHPVEFSPFKVKPKLPNSVHVFFKPGDTSFASTGTHYVEKSGRLLISSSYRWSEDEGPGDTSYVSRVDECPS